MTKPLVELAETVIRRMLEQATELDWAGGRERHAAAHHRLEQLAQEVAVAEAAVTVLAASQRALYPRAGEGSDDVVGDPANLPIDAVSQRHLRRQRHRVVDHVMHFVMHSAPLPGPHGDDHPTIAVT